MLDGTGLARPKGLFTLRFVAHLLMDTFLPVQPIHLISAALAMEGAKVAEGTLVGVLGPPPIMCPLVHV